MDDLKVIEDGNHCTSPLSLNGLMMSEIIFSVISTKKRIVYGVEKKHDGETRLFCLEQSIFRFIVEDVDERPVGGVNRLVNWEEQLDDYWLTTRPDKD